LIGRELTEQSLRSKLDKLPFSRDQLTKELATGESVPLIDPERFKPTAQELEEMTEMSRLARNLLGIQMIEVRALKSGLKCKTIHEFVNIYLSLSEVNRKEYFTKLVYEALLSRQKTDQFVFVIDRIFQQQQSQVIVDIDETKNDLILSLLPFWFIELSDPSKEIAAIARQEVGISLHEATRFEFESKRSTLNALVSRLKQMQEKRPEAQLADEWDK
jgi:hypothetical protein